MYEIYKMETLKKPETLLMIGLSLALIVLGVYVYHKLKVLSEDQAEHSDKLKNTISAIPDMVTVINTQQKVNKILQEVNASVLLGSQEQDKFTDALELAYISIENQRNQIQTLKRALETMGTKIDYPDEVEESQDFPLRPPPPPVRRGVLRRNVPQQVRRNVNREVEEKGVRFNDEKEDDVRENRRRPLPLATSTVKRQVIEEENDDDILEEEISRSRRR